MKAPNIIHIFVALTALVLTVSTVILFNLLEGVENRELEVFKIVFPALGGIGLIGSFVANARIAEISQNSLEQTRKRFEQEQEINELRLISERFSKSVEQISDEKNIAARLGGIYSLEAIAKQEPTQYHSIIVNILAAFVREKVRLPFPEEDDYEPNAARKMATFQVSAIDADIQAALNVIGRRNSKYDDENLQINLRNTCLCRADLKGANLQNADLSYACLVEANLSDANLKDCNVYKANLYNVILSGKTNLDGVELQQSQDYPFDNPIIKKLTKQTSYSIDSDATPF